MMKIKTIVFLVLIPIWSVAQQQLQLALGTIEQHKVDSMRLALNNASSDSVRYEIAGTLSSFFQNKSLDSAIYYTKIASVICRNSRKYLTEAVSQRPLMYYYQSRGDFSNAYLSIMKALEIALDPENEKTHFTNPPDGDFRKQRLQILAILELTYGDLLLHTRNYGESILQYKKAIKISDEIEDIFFLHQRYVHLSWAYKGLNMPDSALHYALLAGQTAKEKNLIYNVNIIYNNKGDLLLDNGMVKQAMESYYEGLNLSEKKMSTSAVTNAFAGLTDCFLAMKQKDSSLFYALKTRENLILTGSLPEINYYKIYENIYQAYLLNNEKDSAFKYLDLAKQARDNYNTNYIKSLSGFQNDLFQDKLKLQVLEKEKIQARNKIRIYLLLGGIGLLLLLSVIFYNTIRHKQKANDSIRKAYSELQDTQRQLIQREKMASLGELTAGIAHEIQNPLNFVNNFSDVNKELLVEMKDEMIKGNLDDANAIANDVIDNEEKINHHGKRADAIVKGMLQHSRSSSGVKEPTDINALADEYLRLAYHGLRAKDKSFNAIMKTDFDESIGKVNIVPQDIGRVILNLINNAFYAVDEKKKQNQNGYEPTVSVSTKKSNGKVEIRVSDNGSGIPQKVLDKIFQPFFTTKPTGQGTGLGLSLSYDIVKTHGGELNVETKEGEGSEFIFQLPVA